MEWIRKNKALKTCLLLGVATYVMCFSVFRHNHIVDGVSVTHFHPFADIKHTSNNEVWAYALSGSFEAVELETNFSFELLDFIVNNEKPFSEDFTQNSLICSNNLRAPPYFLS